MKYVFVSLLHKGGSQDLVHVWLHKARSINTAFYVCVRTCVMHISARRCKTRYITHRLL